MSLYTRLFGKPETKALTLADPEAFGLFGLTPTASGIQVSGSSALRVPAVSCATALISETTGTLPVKLHNTITKETQRDHPAFKLIHDEANEWTSAGQLRTALTFDALTNDTGGFALVTRYSDGRPAELHRLDPATVTIETGSDGAPLYIVRSPGTKTTYPHTEIVHIRHFAGLSPLTLGREAIGLAVAFERHLGHLFRNGARPSGIITAEKPLGDEAKRKIAQSWFSTHSGERSGNTAILDEGMAYQQLAMTLTDAQFAENRLEQVREIARAFRVPPTMLFELTRGTWSNTEEMTRQFYTVTMKPWLRSWEWAYAKALLTPEERATFRIEFVIDDLLTADLATRAAAYGQYRSMGVLTANEVRTGLNLPARADGNSLANPYTTSGASYPKTTPAYQPV